MAIGWTKEQEELLYGIYHNTKNSELGKIFGKKVHAIEEYARRRGLVKTQEHRLASNRKGDLSILLNDSLETYYWIGFSLADGCYQKTNQLTVSLSDKDCEHLEKLAVYLKTNIRYIYNKSQVVVAVQDKIIVPQIMAKYGIPYNKTYSCVHFPFKLTDNQAYAILVGFIDGDGSRNKYGIRIQNYETWYPFYKLMEQYIGNIRIKYVHYRDKKTVVCSLDKIQTNILIKFVNFYNLPAMERKWYPIA